MMLKNKLPPKNKTKQKLLWLYPWNLMSFIVFEKWMQENTYKVFNYIKFASSILAVPLWSMLFGLEKDIVFMKESLEY